MLVNIDCRASSTTIFTFEHSQKTNLKKKSSLDSTEYTVKFNGTIKFMMVQTYAFIASRRQLEAILT